MSIGTHYNVSLYAKIIVMIFSFITSRCVPVKSEPQSCFPRDVWGHNYLFSDRTIDTHITRLRQKIEPNPSAPRYIITLHRVGYKFVME